MEWKSPGEFGRSSQTQYFYSLPSRLLRKSYKKPFDWAPEATFTSNVRLVICCPLSMQFFEARDSLATTWRLAIPQRFELRTVTRCSSALTRRRFWTV